MAESSWAIAAGQFQQGGWFSGTNYANHAALWSGSAASVVDLQPTGAIDSEVYGVSGAHPVGANESCAIGTRGSQQVGWAYFGTNNYGYGYAHAALWTGSAGSFVDLHPAGATESWAIGTAGAQQAGYISVGSNYTLHAALWFGTAGSFVDLHAVLGPAYVDSEAYRMWGAGSTVWIAGRARTASGADHAILWKVVANGPELGQAVEAPELDWSCAGDADWFCQSNEVHCGISSARSGCIGHGQTSCLEASVVGPGTLTFWWKVSSESDYDLLTFCGSGRWASISGDTQWQSMSFKISPGPQVLQWTYSKDGDVSGGEDAAWLDLRGSARPAIGALQRCPPGPEVQQ